MSAVFDWMKGFGSVQPSPKDPESHDVARPEATTTWRQKTSNKERLGRDRTLFRFQRPTNGKSDRLGLN